MDILVIVDMQSDFPASSDQSTIDAVIKQIGYARTRGQTIVVVEYKKKHYKYTPTHYEIMLALEGYTHILVHKDEDDGSGNIMKALIDQYGNALPQRLCFYMCGVNTGYCVGDTAVGLAECGHDVTIITEACNHCEAGSVEFAPKNTEEMWYFNKFTSNGIQIQELIA
jgi:nicotinamidase-related amidase